MSISKRITLFSTGFLFLLLVLVNGSIYFLFQQFSTNAELERMQAQLQTIAESAQGSQSDLWLTSYGTGDGMLRVIREDGSSTLTVTKEPDLRLIPAEYSNRESGEVISYQEQSYSLNRFPIIWVDGSIVSLELIHPLTTLESTLSTLRIVLMIASVLIIIPAYFAGRALGRIILMPVQTLINTMQGIRGSGSFQKIDIKPDAKDELAQMSHTFNEMMELLEENYDKQQRFVSDASHELRTPLTVIESYASLLKRWGMKKPDLLEEAVDAIYDESQRMKGLTKQMLALATGEPDKTVILQQIDLVKSAEDTAKRLRQAYCREIVVTANEKPIYILGDPERIKQLLFIFVENGLKYSDDDIRIMLDKKINNVVLSIQDKGIGIPKDDIPNVFERFFRVDKARSRQTGGSGLGLSIAKAIIDAHGAKVDVQSEEGKGTTFRISFPQVNKKQNEKQSGGEKVDE